MGDRFTTFSGSDWIQEGGKIIGWYFSWISKPSVTIPRMLFTISKSLDHEGFEITSTHLYVLHNIPLQRLVDLNRKMNDLVFLHDRFFALCNISEENIENLILECTYSKKVWKNIGILIGINNFWATNTGEVMLRGWYKKHQVIFYKTLYN